MKVPKPIRNSLARYAIFVSKNPVYFPGWNPGCYKSFHTKAIKAWMESGLSVYAFWLKTGLVIPLDEVEIGKTIAFTNKNRMKHER